MAERVSMLSEVERRAILSELAPTPEDMKQLEYAWNFWARPNQLEPEGDWLTWVVTSGRGFGKTRIGSEAVIKRAKRGEGPMALVGQTKADVRDTMVELFESSIMKVSPPWFMPKLEVTKRRITWPNGAQAIMYSGDEPDQLRGPQHSFCFVAGTMVLTPDGEVPIQSLVVGDYVMTRAGARQVLATGKRVDEVGIVSFSNGEKLTGTRQHPVLSSNGWTNLDRLTQGEPVCSIGELTVRAMSSPIKTDASSISIGRCGKRRTGRYYPVTTSIILTETRPTTISPISGLSTQRNIALSTRPSASHSSLSALIAENLSPASDPTQPLCVNGVLESVPSRSVSQNGLAAIAELPSRAGLDTIVASVVSTWERVGLDTVYNIAVDDAPEYFANGILVHNCWMDELCKFKYPEDTWSNVSLGLRLGRHPQSIITTTPRPIPIMKQLVNDPDVIVTTGSTYENIGNLPPSFIRAILSRYENTRLGAQEIYGGILADVDGALWTRSVLEKSRRKVIPPLVRIVVAIDPSVGGSTGGSGNETGIVVVGLGDDNHCYVLEDASIDSNKPDKWGNKAVNAFVRYGADRMIAESNQGGEMVRHTLHTIDPNLPVTLVHASKGKYTRAEPVSALYSQDRVHHVGFFADLEDQLCAWVPGESSPDRLDALVWGVTEIMLNGLGGLGIEQISSMFSYI